MMQSSPLWDGGAASWGWLTETLGNAAGHIKGLLVAAGLAAPVALVIAYLLTGTLVVAAAWRFKVAILYVFTFAVLAAVIFGSGVLGR